MNLTIRGHFWIPINAEDLLKPLPKTLIMNWVYHCLPRSRLHFQNTATSRLHREWCGLDSVSWWFNACFKPFIIVYWCLLCLAHCQASAPKQDARRQGAGSRWHLSGHRPDLQTGGRGAGVAGPPLFSLLASAGGKGRSAPRFAPSRHGWLMTHPRFQLWCRHLARASYASPSLSHHCSGT